MLARLSRLIEQALLWFCAALFALLSLTVFFQVITRNLLGGGSLWTLELAQLLLSWCVFIGAALGVRRGAHYFVNIVPDHYWRTNAALKVLSSAAITAFAFIMLYYGWQFLAIGARQTYNTLPLTLYWNYLPIPISGGLMLFFMIETWIRDLRAFGGPAPTSPV